MDLFNTKKSKKDKLEKKRQEVLQKVKNGDMSGLKDYGHDKEIVLEAIQNSKENIVNDIALFLQNGDEDVVIALLNKGWGKDWAYYDEKIQNNPHILEIYLSHGGSLENAQINENLFLNNKALALLSFKIPEVKEDLRKRIVERFNDDFDVALEGMSDSGKYFVLLNGALKNQYGIIVHAVKTYPATIFNVDKMWLSDVRVVKTLLKSLLAKLQVDRTYSEKEALSIFLLLGDSAKDSEICQLKKDIIVQIISRQPDSIVHFDSTIQNDPQILEIFLNYGGNYRNLSLLKVETLNNNFKLALEFVKKGGRDIFEDLDLSLKNNSQIAYQAIQMDKSCIHLVTDRLTLVSLLKKDPSLRQIMKPEVFKEVNALLFKEREEEFRKIKEENEVTQNRQQQEKEALTRAIQNETTYLENWKMLEDQRKIIEAQGKEIDALKNMLSSLIKSEDEALQSGKKK